MPPQDPGVDGRPKQDPNDASLGGFGPSGQPKNLTDAGAANAGSPDDGDAVKALNEVGGLHGAHKISEIKATGKMAPIDVTDTDPANLKV